MLPTPPPFPPDFARPPHQRSLPAKNNRVQARCSLQNCRKVGAQHTTALLPASRRKTFAEPQPGMARRLPAVSYLAPAKAAPRQPDNKAATDLDRNRLAPANVPTSPQKARR